MIKRSAIGHIFRSTGLVRELEVGMSNSTDPWANDYFEKNSKAFVVDLPLDELHDYDTPNLQLDSDKDIRDQPKDLSAIYHFCSFTD